jgi:hypothetical protein
MAENLITLSEYKNYVDISSTNSDAVINSLIPRISDFIKNYCNRSFNDFVFDDKVEIFNGDEPHFILAETPIINIVSVEWSTDYGQTYTALTEFEDWVLDGYLIKPIQTTNFQKQLLGYKITYRAGYSELPTDLVLAAMDLVTYYRRNDGTVSSTKFSNTTTMQIEHISDAALPAYIKRVLDNYVAQYV